MRNQVSVKPVKHPRYKWRVAYPETLPDGQKVRRQSFFTDRKSAMSFAATKEVELVNHGVKHSEITDGERRAVIHYREWSASRPDGPSLLDLIREGIVRAEENRPRLSVDEAIAERRARLTAKKRSERHDRDTRLRLDRFSASFGSRQVSEVTGAMVEAWLHGLGVGAVSLGNYRRALTAVFAHAVRRKAIATNPIAEVELPEVRSAIPGTLSADELDRLLHAAAPELRPVLAIQALAGLRRAEAERLHWTDIHAGEGHITIGAGIAKTGSRRIVPIEPALAQWLAVDVRNGGKVAPSPQIYADRLAVARRVAGITEWPPNCLRHTAASCWLTREQDAGRVALWLGNSPAVLKRHYDGLLGKAQALAWFAVVPNPSRFQRNTLQS